MRKNILDLLDSPTNDPSPLVIIRNDVVTFIPFTDEAEEVLLHWGKEPAIRGYFYCNRDDCVYCKIGREQIKAFLLPVYLPDISSIGYLFIRSGDRPYSLLPQIGYVLKSLDPNKPVVVLASKQNSKYKLKTVELTEDMDSGEKNIHDFSNLQEEDGWKAPLLFSVRSNEELLDIPEIANLLQYRGV